MVGEKKKKKRPPARAEDEAGVEAKADQKKIEDILILIKEKARVEKNSLRL